MTIKLNNINFSYTSNKIALKNISIEINNGITGFLGVNGAGKSSLLNILATTISPQSGEYEYDKIDCFKSPLAIREVLGYLPQNIGFLPELTVNKYLTYIGLLKGCSSIYLKENIPVILNMLNLYDQRNTYIKDLSGGMKQRVGIAQTLINKPKIVILDEPIIGLDPNERYNFNSIISEYSKDSIILISSHIIEDIENICENVVILDAGEIKYSGKTSALIDYVQNLVFEKQMNRDEYNNLENKKNIIRTKPLGVNLIVRFISQTEINQSLKVTPTLEDAFIYITKKLD
jgi:ABC-2 type transport system ATP-binding protein